jgi:hypothetical protein
MFRNVRNELKSTPRKIPEERRRQLRVYHDGSRIFLWLNMFNLSSLVTPFIKTGHDFPFFPIYQFIFSQTTTSEFCILKLATTAGSQNSTLGLITKQSFQQITNLTHNSFFLYVYYKSLHVSSNTVLIIRRINCINTTSVIRYISDRLVCKSVPFWLAY